MSSRRLMVFSPRARGRTLAHHRMGGVVRHSTLRRSWANLVILRRSNKATT